jgi:Ca2+-binding RTX toxin-like protein
VLTNFDLVSGLRSFVGTAGAGPDGILGNADDRFGAGNIILGGDGSDLIEGRAGNDLIDGDRWLNVRISVREIMPGSGEFNFDTAWFSGVLADYTIVTDANGVTTVTDVGRGVDGIDRLTNIERLQFSDQALVLAPGLNAEPVGVLTVSDTTPAIGQTLTVSAAGITDAQHQPVQSHR